MSGKAKPKSKDRAKPTRQEQHIQNIMQAFLDGLKGKPWPKAWGPLPEHLDTGRTAKSVE